MSMTVTRKELKRDAKQKMSGKLFKLFLCSLVCITFEVLATHTQIFNLNNLKLQDFSNILKNIPPLIFISILTFFVYYIFLNPVLNLALVKVCLKTTRNQNFTIREFFKNVTNNASYGKTVWLGILLDIFVLLWSVLLIIPGIIKSISYSMSYYILADNPSITAKEAIKESERIMKGHKWDFFVLGLSFVGWFFLIISLLLICVIILCIPILGDLWLLIPLPLLIIIVASVFIALIATLVYMFPYINITYANFYESIKKENQNV